MSNAKPGRNAPCPCGSGKKFKQCCEGKEAAKAQSRGKIIAAVLAALMLLGAAGFVVSLSDAEAQPQIWDEEHGHYHTVGS